MANPTITNYGEIDYVDDANNWRATDIDFLSRRSVLRFPTSAALESSGHNTVGGVAYVADDPNGDDVVEPGADPHLRVRLDASWRRLLVSTNLRIPFAQDGAGAVTLRHASGPGGLTLKSSGAALADSRLEVGSRVVIENGAVALTTSGNTATLVVASNKLTVDKAIVASALETSGAVIGGTGPHTLAGSLTLSSGTVTAPVISGSTSITSPSYLGTNMTLSNGITGTAFVQGGGVRLTGTRMQRQSASTTFIDLGSAIDLESPSGVRFRTATNQVLTNVAGVVVASGAPQAGDIRPDGTIWFETGA